MLKLYYIVFISADGKDILQWSNLLKAFTWFENPFRSYYKTLQNAEKELEYIIKNNPKYYNRFAIRCKQNVEEE